MYGKVFARMRDDEGARDTFSCQDDVIPSRTFAGEKVFKQEEFYELARMNASHYATIA